MPLRLIFSLFPLCFGPLLDHSDVAVNILFTESIAEEESYQLTYIQSLRCYLIISRARQRKRSRSKLDI